MEEFGEETSQSSDGLGKNVEKPVLGKMLMEIKGENKRGPKQVFANTPLVFFSLKILYFSSLEFVSELNEIYLPKEAM